MVAVTPTGTKTLGAYKVSWVATMASITAPTNAEVIAGTSLDVSCYLLADGLTRTVTTNKGNAQRRLCTRVQQEANGVTTYSLSDAHYIVNPQGAAATTPMLAYEKLVPGTSGYFVFRLGLDPIATDWAVGQFVEVWPVQLADRMIDGDPTDEFSDFFVNQAVAVTGVRTERVALA